MIVEMLDGHAAGQLRQAAEVIDVVVRQHEVIDLCDAGIGHRQLDAIGVVELMELIVDAWLTQPPKKLAKSFLEETG